MKVEHIKKVQGTEVMCYAILANARMIEDGSTNGEYHPFSTESQAHFVRDDEGKIAGCIIWREGDDPDVWISLSYVSAHMRRRGCYKAMFEAVVAECRKLNIREIESFVYKSNEAMRHCALSVGRIETRAVYTLKLQTADQHQARAESEAASKGKPNLTTGALPAGSKAFAPGEQP
jgi:GNAT superfamily N-acetyltransferase